MLQRFLRPNTSAAAASAAQTLRPLPKLCVVQAALRPPFLVSFKSFNSKTPPAAGAQLTNNGSEFKTGKSFPVLDYNTNAEKNAPTFLVGVKNGFLPRQYPLARLPDEYKELESLLHRMPLVLPDGKPGLLAGGQFGAAVEKELPLYDLSNVTDQRLLSALYRDITFVASAYLLEPCDILCKKTGKFGLGRQKLPKNVAVPLVTVAKKIGAKPFMEYALSYSLYNYKLVDPKKGLEYSNLALVRGFGGVPAEHGFILVHVAMVSHSGELVRCCMEVLNGAASRNRAKFDEAMKNLREVYQKINEAMETMWERSNPSDYLSFRTFIMGTKNQPMFPNGVVYEGVGANGSDEVMAHRGESGANDSMVPMGDNLLQITESMPQNPLTETLRDFRSYRPTNHKEFLEFVENRAREVDVRQFAEEDSNSAVLYLANIDQIRAFRHRHWNFTKEYILKYTSHPVATGGSPIVTWLPNQLGTVLDAMERTGSRINKDKLTPHNRALAEELVERAETQRRVLDREVAALKPKFKNQDISSDQV